MGHYLVLPVRWCLTQAPRHVLYGRHLNVQTTKTPESLPFFRHVYPQQPPLMPLRQRRDAAFYLHTTPTYTESNFVIRINRFNTTQTCREEQQAS